MDEHVIHVLFLETQPDDPWLNRATANIGERVHGRGFCHVEITMPNIYSGNSAYVSSSIYNGETVTLTQTKTFANPQYVQHSMTVSTRELRDMLKFVNSSHERRVGFDQLGMYCALLPFEIRSKPENSTFCSRYVTECLQFADLPYMRELNSALVTPSKLYKILTTKNNQPTVLGSVGYKQRVLLDKASFQCSRV